MANDLCDNRRKNELITSFCIPIDIYKGKNEVKGKIYSKSRDNQNRA